MPAKDARSAELQKLLQATGPASRASRTTSQGRGGIEHTVLVEEGWVVPGSVIAGGDSHTCTYGALGAFGTGLGSTDIAALPGFGEFWQAVPGTIQVEFTGEKRRYVTGKDLILAVIAEIGVAGGTNMALEFVGDGAEALTIDERLAVANMAVEAGSETGIFPADDDAAAVPRRPHRPALDRRAHRPGRGGRAARARSTSTRCRRWSRCRTRPGNVVPLDEVARARKIDQVYIGNCSNGTMTDLRQAAEMLRGREVHPRRRAIVVPATQRVYREALAEGLLDVFVEAGAMVSTPTCGACFGGGNGVLAPGENAVTTTNRNFRGRMGSSEAGVLPRQRLRRGGGRGGGRARRPGAVVGAGTA